MYDYKSKLVKIDEALNLIKSNDYIVTPVAPAEPREFFTNLPTIADRVKNVRISTCLNMLDYDYITNKKYKDSFIHDAWFYTPTFRAAHQNGNVSYEMANITPKDIDLAEVHDCFTITQIINCEDLGFFEKGKAPKAILEGKTARANGEIAINPSGGLKAKGHPIGATGLSQIYEIVTQLRGEAGKRQVSNAKIGLTHNIGGTAATCVVNIFKEAL